MRGEAKHAGRDRQYQSGHTRDPGCGLLDSKRLRKSDTFNRSPCLDDRLDHRLNKLERRKERVLWNLSQAQTSEATTRYRGYPKRTICLGSVKYLQTISDIVLQDSNRSVALSQLSRS